MNKMKKTIFTGFGLLVVMAVVYAATGIFDGLPKSTDDSASESQKILTADEFNEIVDAVKGIDNIEDSGNRSLGLGVNASSEIDLTVNGILQLGTGENIVCNNETIGMIFFDKADKHFKGCNGKELVQLDVRECNKVNGKCDTVVDKCLAGEYEDVPDTADDYLWMCKGIDCGNTENCSLPKQQSFFCQGDDPKNAVLCENDDQGLVSDVNKQLVEKCTDSEKCEYVCDDKEGYVYKEGDCVK